MKKVIAVAAVIGMAVGLTWAAEQVGGWLGFAQQETRDVADERTGAESPGSEGVLPSREAQGNEEPPTQPELSAEVTSIEDDLARIEEALGNDEVLEEFTPSEPLSADNPVVWPTDI